MAFEFRYAVHVRGKEELVTLPIQSIKLMDALTESFDAWTELKKKSDPDEEIECVGLFQDNTLVMSLSWVKLPRETITRVENFMKRALSGR